MLPSQPGIPLDIVKQYGPKLCNQVSSLSLSRWRDPYPIENIDRLGVLMFQTSDNIQLLSINAELTIVSSLKHKNTQPLYIFNRVRVLHLDRLKEET